MKDSLTYLKNINITPKKLRFYLKDIKKNDPVSCLELLYYGKQKATKILYQALKSAINNAKQSLKVDENMLKFKLFTVEEGQKLKRYRAGGRGTPKSIVKRKSHIKIILTALNEKNKKQEDGLRKIKKEKISAKKNNSEKSKIKQVKIKSSKKDKKS